jgi:hypothetical protein
MEALGTSSSDIEDVAKAMLWSRVFVLDIAAVGEYLRWLGCPHGADEIVVTYLTWVRLKICYLRAFQR